MRLYNVIVLYDVYAVANSSEEARAVIEAAIKNADDPLAPSTSTGLPTSRERDVREAWRGEKPFVANDVSDEDFERCRGKTSMEVFHMIHTKQDAKPEQPRPRKS